MHEFVHGTRFEVFRVQGFRWQNLSAAAKASLHNIFVSPEFFGESHEQYGFAKVTFSGDVYYGAFTQKYHLYLRRYDSPAADLFEQEYSFEDRFFCYVPAENRLALEKRRFTQPQLSEKQTLWRINSLIQGAVGHEFVVTLEPFRHEMSQSELRSEFLKNPTTRLQVQGLNGAIVSDDFRFFNPDFEKNSVSRELFNRLILPSIYSLEVTSRTPGTTGIQTFHDLRENALARMVISLEQAEIIELEVVDEQKGRRKVFKPHYDSNISIETKFSSPLELAQAIIDQLANLPDSTLETKLNRQLRLDFKED